MLIIVINLINLIKTKMDISKMNNENNDKKE